MFQRFAMCLCCLWLCACAGRENASSVPPPADIVSTTLGQAAEQAHEDLAMVARLRGQGMQPLLPPPDPALQRPVSVAWTGPMEGALKEICLQVGYRYQEVGRPSAQTMTVVVRGQNRPAYELLEDIAWQAQPLAFPAVPPLEWNAVSPLCSYAPSLVQIILYAPYAPLRWNIPRSFCPFCELFEKPLTTWDAVLIIPYVS